MRATRLMSSRATTLVTAALLGAAVLAGCGEDAPSTGADGAEGTFPAGSDTGVECSYPADTRGGPAPREVEAPPARAQHDGTVEAVIALGQGDLRAELDAAAAPCTVGSFISLAEQDYFADTPCHRLTASQGLSVLQCGDPGGTGTGGPGYTFADELTGGETYPAGTIAMANAGPDTNGSQFFLVYEDSVLEPSYTVFGTLDDASLEIVRGIAAEGAEGGAPDGRPAAEVVIEDVRGTA